MRLQRSSRRLECHPLFASSEARADAARLPCCLPSHPRNAGRSTPGQKMPVVAQKGVPDLVVSLPEVVARGDSERA